MGNLGAKRGQGRYGTRNGVWARSVDARLVLHPDDGSVHAAGGKPRHDRKRARAGAIHLPMRLVAESETPAAGSHTTLAIVATPEKGWHGYWKNGGDAGLPTEAHWTLPKGVSAGELRYPVPGQLKIAGLMNYVYERPFTLLVDLSVPAGLAKGTPLPVTVKLDYLVCTDTICVPESQTLSTTLTVGDGAVAAATRAESIAGAPHCPSRSAVTG